MGSQLKQWKDRIIHQGKSAGMYKCSLARHPWSLQRSQIHTGLVQHNHFITFAFIQVFFTLSHLYHVHSFSTVHQIHSWYKTPTFFHDSFIKIVISDHWAFLSQLFSFLRRNTTGGGKRTRSSTELMSSAISTVRLEISFFILRDHDCFPRDRFVPGGGPLCLRGLPLRPQPDAGAGCRDAWKQGDIIVPTNLLHIRRISFVLTTSTSTPSPSMC